MQTIENIKFNKKIYRESAILETINDYNELCKMELTSDDNSFLLQVSDFDTNDSNFIDEIKNYVLEGCI